MLATSATFEENSRRAMDDVPLQQALGKMKVGFQEKRRLAVERMPEWEELRNTGKAIKDHTLAHIDFYLEAFEKKVLASGGHVHWARTAAEARDIILKLCQDAGARTVTKGKSMIAEEIALNDHLAAHGVVPIETDLGEYIIQLREEPPSHIIAPAVHSIPSAT